MQLPRQYTSVLPTGAAGGSGDVFQICNAGGMAPTITATTTVWSVATDTAQFAAYYSHKSRHDRGAIIALAILFSLTLLALIVILCCVRQRSRSKNPNVNTVQGNQEIGQQEIAGRSSRRSRVRKDQKFLSAVTDEDSTVVAYGGRRHRRRDGRPVKHYDEEVESEGDSSSFVASEGYPQFPRPAAYFPPTRDHHEMQVPADPQGFQAPISRAAERKIELMNDVSEVGSKNLEAEYVVPSKLPQGRGWHSKTSESVARGRSRRG